MSDAAPLLVELLCEELPPKALARLGDAFAAGLLDALREQQLAVDDARGVPFATPRRLAVLIDPVRARAPDQTVRVKGPSVSVGLDANGEPTVALRKWADKQGASLEQLSRESDGRQDSFWFTRTQAGAALDSAIEAAIARALERLPIPKVMHYQLGDGTTTVSFVRPAHGLLVLHGTAVLPASVLGLRSSRLTHGHRFLGRAEIELEHANDYERRLTDEGRVIPSFARRRSRIESMLRDAAAGLRASLGDDAEVSELLDEVTALVEWPAVYVGEFEREFLSVPQECLILTMRTNQKYFPLFDAQGRLEPRFLIVSNMQIADASNIVDGNERVVRPRLADARFFFEQDRRRRLAERVPQLAQVVYHAKLGTLAQRVDRIRALAGAIATRLGTDAAAAEHAATLAKADLLTAMVGEFPELQGVMGRHYALHDGEPAEVCEAIAEHYRPRYSGDALPRTDAGTAVALADKLETLAGIWGIGQQPTGERDPFALRRHALGIVRIAVERELPLSLRDLLQHAFAAFEGVTAVEPDVDGLAAFIVERLRSYLRERGFAPADLEAVLATDADRLDQVRVRLEAIAAFRALPEADSLSAANKRIGNILRKSAAPASAAAVDADLLAEPAERTLHRAVAEAAPAAEQRLARGDYAGALVALAVLREPVDRFFDQVMVNVDDERLRGNRLALLAGLHRLMNRVADLSKLAG